MKRTILIVLGALLTVAGLVLFSFAIAYFIRNWPGEMVSQPELGQYLPWYTLPGVLSAAVGIILLTFRRHY